jgi:hypothetical protein
MQQLPEGLIEVFAELFSKSDSPKGMGVGFFSKSVIIRIIFTENIRGER